MTMLLSVLSVCTWPLFWCIHIAWHLDCTLTGGMLFNCPAHHLVLTYVIGHNSGSTFRSSQDANGCKPRTDYASGHENGVVSWRCYRLLPRSYSMGMASEIWFRCLTRWHFAVYQAWIEASTKGAVLIFAASEIEERTVKNGLNPAAAGLLGGMGGGIAQAYATMGEYLLLWTRLRFRGTTFHMMYTISIDWRLALHAMLPQINHLSGLMLFSPRNQFIWRALWSCTMPGFTTCMKTAEITRHKQAATGVKPPSTWAVFMDIFRKEGLAGVNKGVNAVAVRQCTNWGSRYVGNHVEYIT